MLKSVDLIHFKGFKRFTVHFAGSVYVVGPNNAGKTTLVQSLRACAHMLRYATTRSPDGYRRVDGRQMLAYDLGDTQLPLVVENIRHEFIPNECRIVLNLKSGARLTAVWPSYDNDDEPHGFFFLETVDGRQPRRPKEVQEAFPRIGVVPSPSPLEHVETVLSPEYVKRNEDGRLASRHFRNQVYYLKTAPAEDDEYEAFLDYVEAWTPELKILNVRARTGVKERELDLFYREPGSRKEKELVWSGDGLQIWLQLLFHLFRCRRDPVVVLDEPDVYLHADLQRRLVRVLESHAAQTVLATHSAEVLGEAPVDSVIWVDRVRRHAVRAPEGHLLEQLSGALGSQFNMRLARALRARAALFFEGDDHRILRSVAKTLGATRVANEVGVALIPIGGFSAWDKIEPFVWLVEKLLEKSVSGYVVLDRDYRPDYVIRDVETKLRSVGLHAHVWRRKELESYLLVPAALARASGAAQAWVESELQSCADSLEDSVFARGLDEHLRYGVSASRGRVAATEEFKAEFDRRWADPPARIEMAPAKVLLAKFNSKLAASNHKAVSVAALAKTIRPDEVPLEMKDLVLELEQLSAGARE